MRPADEIEHAVRNMSFKAGPEMDKALWADTARAQSQSQKTKLAPGQQNLRRMIMKRPITKLAVAAVIIIAVILSTIILDKSVSPAYAIEQTIEANHTVRYLHIKYFDAKREDEPKEAWTVFDQSGQVKNVRIHIPEWDSPSDGAKVAVWKENILQVWLRDKNVLATIRDQTVAAHMLKLAEECDPRLAVERLYEQEAQDKVEIKIDEPSDKDKPITVTATYLPESSTPDQRWVLFVDQVTKLVMAIEYYRLENGQYEYTGVREFYGYNQPIEAKMFALNEVPLDVLTLDQITQEIGLAQGKLTDKEIAIKVVRQFFEALIAKDYAEAGRLYQGISAEKMREVYGEGGSFIRIVSIGEPSIDPEFGGLRVPCTIEIKKNGKIIQWQPYGLLVRQVQGQPNRWTICGGI